MPNPAQHFDDTALGEQPPTQGNTADPTWPTGGLPSTTGHAVEMIQSDPTVNVRADQTQKGPTHYATPGAGVHTWPAIQSYNGEKV